jgi:hypothetical protein
MFSSRVHRLPAVAFAILTAVVIVMSVPSTSFAADRTVSAATAKTTQTASQATLDEKILEPGLDLRAHTNKFRGFCVCSCSSIPNCNTSADCGGSACTRTISCCAKPTNKGGDQSVDNKKRSRDTAQVQ